MSNEQDRDMAEVIAKIEKAMDEVSALCNGKKWRMCIPAERDSDSDLVIDDALHAAKDALLASSQGQGDGSHKSPFRGSFNPVCLQRHDSDLMVGICERDDAFELIVTPPRTGPQRHYRINSDGSWTDQSQPPDKPEPRGDALEILEAVANYQVQEYAGANYSCLFCGGVDGTHETDCISLKAAALLASSQPQPDGLRAMVTVDFVDAIESIATRYRDSGQCTFYATVTELLDLLPAIRATLAQPQPDGLKPEPRGDAHGDIKHMALDIIDCIKLAGEMWDKHAGNPAGTALASDKLRFAVEYVNSLAHDAALLASSQGQGDEEAACLQLIAERDNAEEMVDDLLDLVGVEHEWSNLYNYNDALTDAKNKLAHPQPDESQGQGDEPWLALVDLYGLVTDYATIPDEEYHKITNAADLIQSNIGTLRTTHPQPDESQGQGELPEVKHLDGAFCDLVVTYSQAEFLLSKATGRKITLGHYIHPQPDEGLREALEAIDAYGKSPVDGRDEVLWFADILKIARAALAKGEGE